MLTNLRMNTLSPLTSGLVFLISMLFMCLLHHGKLGGYFLKLHRVRVLLTGVLAMMMTGCATANPSASSQTPPGVQNPTSASQRASSQTGFAAHDAPVEMMGLAGAFYSNVAWPFQGATLSGSDAGMQAMNFSKNGFTLDGVHWTWPHTDDSPSRTREL